MRVQSFYQFGRIAFCERRLHLERVRTQRKQRNEARAESNRLDQICVLSAQTVLIGGRPCRGRFVADAEVTAASNFKGYFSIGGDSTATSTS